MTYSGLTAKEGFDNLDEAKRVIAEAESIHGTAQRRYQLASKRTTRKLEDLATRKMELYRDTIKPSIEIIKRFQEVRESEVDLGVEELDGPIFTEEEIKRIEEATDTAERVLEEVGQGVSIMQVASRGSFGLMAQFGTASTGTAISSLHGAAATNATLAALGGGSLAAGGGGMALGSAVLGGVTVIPAAVTMSYKFAAESEKSLTRAHKHFSEVNVQVEKLKTAVAAMQLIDMRVRELKHAITQLAERYDARVLPRLNKVFETNRDEFGKVHFPSLTAEDKKTMLFATIYLKCIKDTIAVPVLDADGNPSAESAKCIVESRDRAVEMEA